MPELPEVEITRRHLEPEVVGRKMEKVTLGHPRTARHNASADEVSARLTGRTVETLRRKGKFLVASLDDGQYMVVHLGMSGRFSVAPTDVERPLHTHLAVELAGGNELRFIDPRTFGFVAVYDEDELMATGLGRLGPDALDELPTPDQLAHRLEGRTAPIKALLLDQRIISGLGNIYADEVLHLARIHPSTPGGRIDRRSIGRLIKAVRSVLAEAIDHGGTTLDDLAYLLPDGAAGENLDRLAVYGREGEPCERCGKPVERVVIRGRSSHFCPKCQRL